MGQISADSKAAEATVKKQTTFGYETLEKLMLLLGMLGALMMAFAYTFGAVLVQLLPRRFRRHSIEGQVALITGGGSGIGRLLCLKLAKKGCKIITWDVNTAGNEETVRQVTAAGFECSAATVDLCSKEDIYRAGEELQQQGIKVDILVNNAGIVTGQNFLQSPDYLVERTFAVNILSHFWTVKTFLPAMISSNQGHIVTVASMAGKIGSNKLIDYSASKFAAVGFDESLRMELMVNKNTGIHTTLVAPFYISTGMFDGVKSKVIPILEPEYVASEIVDGILLRSKEVVLPSYGNIFVFLKLSVDPEAWMQGLHFLGLLDGMEDFQGRNQKAK